MRKRKQAYTIDSDDLTTDNPFSHACSFCLNLILGRTRGGGEVGGAPQKVLLSFFLEDKTSAPGVFSSCLFIPRTNFETSLVMVSCYGYEIADK